MRHYILLFICIAFSQELSAQTKTVVSFYSAVTAIPVDKQLHITDIIYLEGQFDSLQKQSVRASKAESKKIWGNIGRRANKVVDGAQIVDYESDTLYLLRGYNDSHYIDAPLEINLKTGKGAFNLFQTEPDGLYHLEQLEQTYVDAPADYIDSEMLLRNTLFSWDIDRLVKIIKVSGGVDNYSWISVARVIIKNNQVAKKEIINFKPAVWWTLQPIE